MQQAARDFIWFYTFVLFHPNRLNTYCHIQQGRMETSLAEFFSEPWGHDESYACGNKQVLRWERSQLSLDHLCPMCVAGLLGYKPRQSSPSDMIQIQISTIRNVSLRAASVHQLPVYKSRKWSWSAKKFHFPSLWLFENRLIRPYLNPRIIIVALNMWCMFGGCPFGTPIPPFPKLSNKSIASGTGRRARPAVSKGGPAKWEQWMSGTMSCCCFNLYRYAPMMFIYCLVPWKRW